MINIKSKLDCCGCTACVSVCGYNAITMIPDTLGFLYPKVNMNLCVNCGLCEKVCQFHSNYERYGNYVMPEAYQFRLMDENQLKRSQSGGAFYALAKHFIDAGGIVYGASFTNSLKVRHQKAKNKQELETLRMSKYVQSDMRDVFYQVKEMLKNEKNVLFTGTSCQIAGLKSYIPNKLHNHLYCIDIICHGVPSPQIWNDYINYLQRTRKSKIKKACFRDKRFGWHGATESFLFGNDKEEFRKTYNYLYFTGLSLRDSCSNCHFTNLNRIGDLTIGDQWGISKDSPFEDNKGLSLILVNSQKGYVLLQNVTSEAYIEKCKIEDCMQPQLKMPVTMNPKRKQFISDYERKGFHYVAKKYSDIGIHYKINRFIELIKDTIKSILKT